MGLFENDEHKNLLRLINSLYLTVVTNEKGIIEYISDDYKKVLNVENEKVFGRHIMEIIPNSKIPEVIENERETIGDIFTLKNGNNVVCNRTFIRAENNKIVGLISTATFQSILKARELNMKIDALTKENQTYRKEIKKLKESKNNLNSIIGSSEMIVNLKKKILKVLKLPISILITGETGTGKEVFASSIHELSDRSNNHFVKINCAAIPKDLIESELFGYAPGAFSGALKSGKIGKFEYANKGTILLDEIGEMPISLQSKLLRVLEEREIERIGENKIIPVDIRIICSTNRDLKEMVKIGKFREDLYYRINEIEINLPPLRERISDLKELVDFFINKYNIEYGLGIVGIKENVIEALTNYSWPGNVRELKNVIKVACILRGSGILEYSDFEIFDKNVIDKMDCENDDINDSCTLEELKENLEKKYIIKTLLKTNGNKSIAAKMLGIDRTYLYTKLKKYNIGF